MRAYKPRRSYIWVGSDTYYVDTPEGAAKARRALAREGADYTPEVWLDGHHDPVGHFERGKLTDPWPVTRVKLPDGDATWWVDQRAACVVFDGLEGMLSRLPGFAHAREQPGDEPGECTLLLGPPRAACRQVVKATYWQVNELEPETHAYLVSPSRDINGDTICSLIRADE